MKSCGLIVAAALAAPAASQNMLVNESFEVEGPDGASASMSGVVGAAVSAAENWFIFQNTPVTTKTELLPSTLPGGGPLMMHVTTNGGSNGIEQVMLPIDTGPACVEHQVWVYVESGVVFAGAGNGGNTGPNAFSTTTGQWELLIGNNIICPANLFIVYAGSPNGADFYIDIASVEAVPCQGPPGDLNTDGTVDGADLGLLLTAWGPCPGCDADFTGEGQVDGADLGLLLTQWGTCSAFGP
jgi:hypothetical protein